MTELSDARAATLILLQGSLLFIGLIRALVLLASLFSPYSGYN